ncbi:hypothetical protein M885DRAFT_541556 [Pelagophyceae sp. CCMP2097]|nr:hypothetical protein M885DRAFT_541556 [Pelagophyceae sp. CCMP2097]
MATLSDRLYYARRGRWLTDEFALNGTRLRKRRQRYELRGGCVVSEISEVVDAADDGKAPTYRFTVIFPRDAAEATVAGAVRNTRGQRRRRTTGASLLGVGAVSIAMGAGALVVGSATMGIGLVPYAAVCGFALTSGGATLLRGQPAASLRELTLGSYDEGVARQWRRALYQTVAALDMEKDLSPTTAAAAAMLVATEDGLPKVLVAVEDQVLPAPITPCPAARRVGHTKGAAAAKRPRSRRPGVAAAQASVRCTADVLIAAVLGSEGEAVAQGNGGHNIIDGVQQLAVIDATADVARIRLRAVTVHGATDAADAARAPWRRLCPGRASDDGGASEERHMSEYLAGDAGEAFVSSDDSLLEAVWAIWVWSAQLSQRLDDAYIAVADAVATDALLHGLPWLRLVVEFLIVGSICRLASMLRNWTRLGPREVRVRRDWERETDGGFVLRIRPLSVDEEEQYIVADGATHDGAGLLSRGLLARLLRSRAGPGSAAAPFKVAVALRIAPHTDAGKIGDEAVVCVKVRVDCCGGALAARRTRGKAALRQRLAARVARLYALAVAKALVDVSDILEAAAPIAAAGDGLDALARAKNESLSAPPPPPPRGASVEASSSADRLVALTEASCRLETAIGRASSAAERRASTLELQKTLLEIRRLKAEKATRRAPAPHATAPHAIVPHAAEGPRESDALALHPARALDEASARRLAADLWRRHPLQPEQLHQRPAVSSPAPPTLVVVSAGPASLRGARPSEDHVAEALCTALSAALAAAFVACVA